MREIAMVLSLQSATIPYRNSDPTRQVASRPLIGRRHRPEPRAGRRVGSAGWASAGCLRRMVLGGGAGTDPGHGRCRAGPPDRHGRGVRQIGAADAVVVFAAEGVGMVVAVHVGVTVVPVDVVMAIDIGVARTGVGG